MPKPRVKIKFYMKQKVARKVEQYAQLRDICFTNALEKLVRAGAEALMGTKKEASANGH